MGKSKKLSSKKTVEAALYVYLQNVNPDYISLNAWGRNWTRCHGETRSKSPRTFHIMARLSSKGIYMTQIDDAQTGTVAGTCIEWGTRQPSLPRVVRHYQAMYGVGDYPSSSSSSGSGHGGGGGGGGHGGGASGRGLYGPHRDEYGGYFYNDDAGNYHRCDHNGNLLDGAGTSYTQAAYYAMYGC